MKKIIYLDIKWLIVILKKDGECNWFIVIDENF